MNDTVHTAGPAVTGAVTTLVIGVLFALVAIDWFSAHLVVVVMPVGALCTAFLVRAIMLSRRAADVRRSAGRLGQHPWA